TASPRAPRAAGWRPPRPPWPPAAARSRAPPPPSGRGSTQFVPIHLQEQRTVAARRDRRHRPVLAATAALDADDLRAIFREQRRAVRARDVASEVQYANAVKHGGHTSSHSFRTASLPRRSCAVPSKTICPCPIT